MRYTLLGRTGLRVSELCLGTMTFGQEWGWGAPRAESRKIFDAFARAGGNFLDTADGYTDGSSERMLGEFIRTERSRFVVATKYGFNRRPGDPNAGGNHRKRLRESLEGSLKRLRTDHVDLLWVHAWDQLTPIEETLRALDDVVRAGKVLHLGVSNMPAWLIAQANTLALCRGWTPFAALQVEYSLVERTPERELLPMAREFGLAVTPWSPLGGGLLTGKYNQAAGRRGGGKPRLTVFWQDKRSPRNLEIAAAVQRAAAELGCSAAQVALAWLRAQPGTILPILGARTVAQLTDNLGCLEVTLPPKVRSALEAASRIEPGYPHDFLARVRERLHGGTWERIDRP